MAIDAGVRPKPCTTMTVSASVGGVDEQPVEAHRSRQVTGMKILLPIIGSITLVDKQRLALLTPIRI
ncbi:MAG: hypothetical protein Ct9H300mP15_12950 [Gemmatimonadota bacterium]|nr:MAG: hypothetical protein Ct9H300mP15_12950 [Gemmatimonadota bacterium]